MNTDERGLGFKICFNFADINNWLFFLKAVSAYQLSYFVVSLFAKQKLVLL